MDTKEIAFAIAKIVDEKKAEDVAVLELCELSDNFDYFVICTCSNARHVDAVVDEVENRMRDEYELRALLTEGKQEGEWALVDFGSVILHVFQEEVRNHYKLEELWGGWLEQAELEFDSEERELELSSQDEG